MTSKSSIQLLGNAYRLDYKYTPSGKAVLNFSVRESYRVGEEWETVFYPCTAWEKTADLINKFVSDGDPIYLELLYRHSVKTGEDGKKITYPQFLVKSVTFLGEKKEKDTVDEQKETDRIPF